MSFKHDLTLVELLDKRAIETPGAPWAKLPSSTETYDDGFRCITLAMLANAVDHLAHLIRDAEVDGHVSSTLAYFGPWDPRFVMLVLAAKKAGHKMLLPSPIQPLHVVLKLMKDTDCTTILAPRKGRHLVASQAAKITGATLIGVPSIEALLSAEKKPFPYSKGLQNAYTEPLVIMHTSGSTGLPKPIVWTEGWAASFCHQITVPPPPGFQSHEALWQGKQILLLMPAFHSGSLFTALLSSIISGSVAVLPLPTAKIELPTVKEVLSRTRCDVLVTPPHIFTQLAADADLLEWVSARVQTLVFGSGPVPQEAGDAAIGKVKLLNMYGSTENGIFATMQASGPWNNSHWQSFEFHPDAGTEMRPVELDELQAPHMQLFELVVKRNSPPAPEQPVFNIPGITGSEWRAKDLFVRDPAIPNSWRYYGRLDDLIVFATGTKFAPADFENAIVAAHSGVSAAVVVGSGRPHAVLVVETSTVDTARVRDELQPTIDQENRMCNPLSTITRDRIIVTSADKKPLPRTAKGSIAKKRLMEEFKDELEVIYGS